MLDLLTSGLAFASVPAVCACLSWLPAAAFSGKPVRGSEGPPSLSQAWLLSTLHPASLDLAFALQASPPPLTGASPDCSSLRAAAPVHLCTAGVYYLHNNFVK